MMKHLTLGLCHLHVHIQVLPAMGMVICEPLRMNTYILFGDSCFAHRTGRVTGIQPLNISDVIELDN